MIADLPTTGWRCECVLDAKTLERRDAQARCQLGDCNQPLRWIHLLVHENGEHSPMEVGRCCAERLCYGYDAKAAEQQARNVATRLARFVDPSKWRQSRKNPANVCRTVQLDGRKRKATVTVFSSRGAFCASIAASGVQPKYVRGDHLTQHEAMRAAFYELLGDK